MPPTPRLRVLLIAIAMAWFPASALALNGRSAGPIEIRTRMQDACYYDEDTLYHELTLDL